MRTGIYRILWIGLLLVGVNLIVAYGAASADTCPASLRIIRPIDGAEVRLQEVVEAAVTGRPVKVALLDRANSRDWWVQADSSAPEHGKILVVAQFGEKGIGAGEIFDIVALVDVDGRFRRADRLDRLPSVACRSTSIRVRKTRD